MARRRQKDHDSKVDLIAKRARARGNRDVRADLPGSRRPELLGGRRPDVTWKQPNGRLVIREIDPPGPMSKQDRAQDRALRNKAKDLGADYRRLKYRPKRR